MNIRVRILTVMFACVCMSCVVLAAEDSRPEYICYMLEKAPVIDGDLSDWPKVPFVVLGREDQAVGDWKGPEDVSATIRMGWDEKGIYFGIHVQDNEIVQTFGDANAENIWQEDSVQWAIDIQGDGGSGYDEDDYEYGFGVTAGQPCVYRWHVSASQLVRGRTDQVSLAVKKTDAGVIYEAFVPFGQLMPLIVAKNPIVGFTIVINDRDAGNIKKSLEWTSGIGTGKEPALFGKLRFSQSSASDDASIQISGKKYLHKEPSVYKVFTQNDSGGKATWKLKNEAGKDVASGKLTPARRDGDITIYEWMPSIDSIGSGTYTWEVQIAGVDKRQDRKASYTFEIINVSIDKLNADVKKRKDRLQQLVQEAQKSNVDTSYAESMLAVVDLFRPFNEEDEKDKRYVQLTRNLQSLISGLDVEAERIQLAMRDKNKAEFWNIPQPDMSKLAIRDGHLYSGDELVMIMGMQGWMWEFYKDREIFKKLGYNSLKINLEPISTFDSATGEPIQDQDFGWWAIQGIIKQTQKDNMNISSTIHIRQVWDAARVRGVHEIKDLQESFRQYLQRKFTHVDPNAFYYYYMSTEATRPISTMTSDMLDEYRQWLKSEYVSIENYNKTCRKEYSNFSDVDFPDNHEANIARLYDRTTFMQQWVVAQIYQGIIDLKKFAPHAYVGDYVSYLMVDDESDFRNYLVNPYLNIAHYDVCDADTAGSFTSPKYLLNTIHWMCMYRDLFNSIGPDMVQMDSEFHFSDHRAFPAGWVPAIYFQAYIHGLSGNYGWGWIRSGSMDSALLLEAEVCSDLSRTNLDVRRLVNEIKAFHDMPAKVRIFYSQASTSPAIINEKNPNQATHLKQIKDIYEALFFTGRKLGFVVEEQAEKGDWSDCQLLIVSGANHVSDKAVEQISEFAQKGGKVILIGDNFTYDRRGRKRNFKPVKNMLPLPMITGVEQFRYRLRRIVETTVKPSAIQVKQLYSKNPTVEWRYASTPSGNEYLYLLNIGHGKAKVKITGCDPSQKWNDCISGNTYSNEIILTPLNILILKSVIPPK